MMWAWHLFFDGKVAYAETGCVLWVRHQDGLGYGRAGRIVGEVKTHRISWTLAFGPIPRGLHILHSCDVRHCVNPHHLSLGTHYDNMQDMVAKGRCRAPVMMGTANPNAVLTEDDVYAIRHMLRMKLFTQAEIVRSYKVAPMVISRIATGKSWQHVTPNYPYDTKGTWQ